MNKQAWGNWHPFTLYTEAQEIECHSGMSSETMMDIASKWRFETTVRIYEVVFKDGHPKLWRTRCFYGDVNDSAGSFVEFMADISLTHRVLFVDEFGCVFISESKDHQTNIDADLIDAMLSAYR